MNEHLMKCDHDPRSENSTLVKMPKRILVHPQKIDYYCKCCGKFYTYTRDSEGNYILTTKGEK